MHTLPALMVVVAPPAADLRLAADCPLVFGSGSERQRAQRLRQRELERVWEGESAVLIVHTTAWSEPERIAFRSLELIGIREDASGPVAVVRLDPEREGLDCPAGLYALRVDDAIGDGRVIALVADAILLVRKDDLAYVIDEHAEPPSWRMAWHPEWRFVRPPSPAPARRR